MTDPEVPNRTWTEADRLAALARYDILDTPAEAAFDDITRLAAQICDVPIAVVNLIAKERQWFKSERGLGVRETPLDVSICAHAILQPGLFVIPDTTKDARFACNPLVTGEPGLRFYAGALLETPEGLPLGTLCVLDYKPREITEDQGFALKVLARHVMGLLEARLRVAEAERLAEDLRRSTAQFRVLADSMPQIVWSTRQDGYHDYFNRRWYAYTGTRPGDTDGDGWLGLFHPEDLDRIQRTWRHAYTTGEPYEIEYRLRAADGSYRWFIGRALPERNADGQIVRWYGTCTDVEDQKRTEAALAESRARLELAQEATGVGTWEWDVKADAIRWSASLCQLYGQDLASGTFDLMHWVSRLHPDDQSRALAAVTDLIEHPRPLDLEFRAVLPDGRVRWLLSRYRPEPGPDERAMVVRGVDVDISERKLAEERERLLMREVDHRAKNTLAVVLSLVRLTRAETKEEFADAVEGRVAAMARAHSVLARDKWTGADLATLVRDELDLFPPVQVQASGPEVTFVADAVMPVGLALHELATNAAKYGALSTEAGQLDLAWRIDGQGSLVLDWRESGGPPTAPPTHRGFGSTLLRTTIEEQLGGRLLFDWRPEGLMLEIRLPSTHLCLRSGLGIAPEAGAQGGPLPRRVLVVEDGALIAMELENALRGMGCDVVGPALTLADAERLAGNPMLDAAVLDVDMHGCSSLPLARRLRSRGIRVLLCTGYEDVLDADWGDAPRLAKPFSRQSLTAAMAALISPPPSS
ncbi:PAS domain-containing protein [Indioceanicola profundi]|uniref:PAS domain-containing protein n=1 Tax=Indioceanicola profundi TaxID=2220096 RepID=UPI001CEDC874|nr:PAS domain-containing protein [Indioceanicola profundi]